MMIGSSCGCCSDLHMPCHSPSFIQCDLTFSLTLFVHTFTNSSHLLPVSSSHLGSLLARCGSLYATSLLLSRVPDDSKACIGDAE
jgi:hypothetical protein